VTSLPLIGVAERRARLARRHGLAAVSPADGAVEVARRVVALHATDPASVFLAIQARTAASAADIEHALYESQELVRMLGMRRTMFVVPAPLAPVVQAAATEQIAAVQRRRLLALLAQADIDGDPAKWLADVERSVLGILAARQDATGAQLAQEEPRLRTSVLLAEGKPYEAKQNITSRVLLLLGAEGHIVRGRPIGSWLSSQHRWTLTERWLGQRLPPLSGGEARTELARAWLSAFGPAPVADLRWWTGWTAAQVKAALAAVGPIEVDLDGETGIGLADDLAPTEPAAEWAALLPALDPTVMGWSQRDWYLGRHGPALFDRTGNVGPSVWFNGQIVGGWAQRADGEIAVRLLDDIGADGEALVQARAERLGSWLGEVRITPRFRTPTERALSG
jgi:hypothetical protein